MELGYVAVTWSLLAVSTNAQIDVIGPVQDIPARHVYRSNVECAVSAGVDVTLYLLGVGVRSAGVSAVLDIKMGIALELHNVRAQWVIRVERIAVHVPVKVDRYIRHCVLACALQAVPLRYQTEYLAGRIFHIGLRQFGGQVSQVSVIAKPRVSQMVDYGIAGPANKDVSQYPRLCSKSE